MPLHSLAQSLEIWKEWMHGGGRDIYCGHEEALRPFFDICVVNVSVEIVDTESFK